MFDLTEDDAPTSSELIDNSSFGTQAARNLRARTAPEVAQQITDRVHSSAGRATGHSGAELRGERSTGVTGRGLHATAPERSRLARERLARELRRLRTEAKMTGTATARATGMSQSKLSKIENGMLLPSVTDVERLVAELAATRETRIELVELARSLHAEAETRRVVLHRGAHRHQQTISRVEARAATSRFFQINQVPSLLQSEPYLRTVMATKLQSEQEAAAAALRIRRSRMDDLAKQFVFLLSEAALRWRMGSAELMAEQVEHLAAIQRRPNVRLGVIPWSADANVVALHGFQIYDERVVTISVLTGNATITDPLDVREYLGLFSRLDRLAVRGEELQALLKRIAEDHRRLG